MPHVLRKISQILLFSSLAVGCGENHVTSSLQFDGPVGSYSSIILYSTSAADPAIKTPNSGSLIIRLAADGTTSGHLLLAAFNGNPAVDADMAGTWTRTGNNITFQQAADTFVRNMTFTIEQIDDNVWFLVGDDVFAGTRFNVRLAHS
ncbi:MAG TPA: hypothetical protein VJ865_03620 [Gemmatimonadaceae bacterium]|nr:hypothetical protein [Gemmatimonadaceae bacterium]